MLTARQKTVLFQIVRCFVQDGEPVSSSTVANSGVFDVSSATIRNVMSDLEGFGLLHQPHTSSGRVPTTGGLRLYVDDLHADAPLDDDPALGRLRSEVSQLDADDPEAAARAVGGLLSDLVRLTSIVAAPSVGKARLQDIHLTPLSDRRILVVLVTSDEQLFHRVVRMEQDLGAAEMRRIQNYLSGLTIGLTLEQVRTRVRVEMQELEREWNDMVRCALEIGEKALEVAQPSVWVEGKLNVFDYAELTSDVDRLKHLLEVLEEKERVLDLLDGVLDTPNPKVLIGHELELDLGEDVSLILCGYGEGPEPVGVLGLLGPSRLDYDRIVPLIHHTARTLTEYLQRR